MIIRYPKMREELIKTLKALSDREYQQSAWIEGKYPKGKLDDNFDYAVHFLFDDHDFDEDPEGFIGYCLINKEEAKLINSVTKSIDKLLSELGNDLTDLEYTLSPLWKNVIQTSKQAYEVIKFNSSEVNLPSGQSL